MCLCPRRWSAIALARWRPRASFEVMGPRIPRKRRPRLKEYPMQAIARARYVRISPRKVDQILMLVRGKSVARALTTLRLVTKGARPLVEKVLRSALANAGKQVN